MLMLREGRTTLSVMDEGVTAETEVRRLARSLLPRATEIAARVTERVVREVPELAPAGTPDALALVMESTDQNIGAMISTLAFGIGPTSIEPPAGTHSLLANLTEGGGDITHLLRAYRVGHQLLWRLWSEHVHAEIQRPDLLAGVLEASSAHLFDIIDRICRQVTDATGPGRAAADPFGVPTPTDRAGTVRRLLGSGPVDLPGAGAVLGYDVSQHHVALLVVPLSEAADPRHALDRVIRAAGGPALVVPSGEGDWWGWLGSAVPFPDARLAELADTPAPGVLVGMGEPGRGRDGFRRSLTQAREAVRVGRLSSAPGDGVLRHRGVEIAAMLCGDPERARVFAVDRLGALARRDDTGSRLRETLRVVLAHAHNRGEAARELQVHHKTIAYRINQAEELLGHPLSQDAYGLQTALLIDHVLHGA
jgi:hypothetical protein